MLNVKTSERMSVPILVPIHTVDVEIFHSKTKDILLPN